MTVAEFDALQPTSGSPANSFEYGLDIQIGGAWLNIADIVDLQPTFTPKTRARGTYAARGKTINRKYAEDVAVSCNIEPVRNASGQYQAVLQYLLDVSALMGEANIIPCRFYDQRGADFAYQGRGAIECRSRAGTGADEASWFALSITGDGDWVKIANPQNTTSAPGVASAAPSGAAAGQDILIRGVGFTGVTGTTGVKFGGTNATAYVVVSDTEIIATLPTGSAGSAPIIVTHPTRGASTPLPYTRGA